NFSDGYDSASQVLQDQIAGAQETARIQLVERAYLRGALPGPAEKGNFAAYACAGVTDLSEQRAAIGTLKNYSKVIADLTKSPDANVAALWKSIKDAQAKHELKAGKPIPSAVDCTDEVTGLLDIGPDRITEAGPFAALIALAGLVETIDKIIVGGLTLAD